MAVSTKIVHRRDTASNWTTTNPTLANGELGFETDTLKFKIGNGSTAWTSLKYSQDASLLSGAASITSVNTTATINAVGDISTAGIFKSNNSSGDEGGQIDLTKATTNTTLTTGVTIDVFQDKVRIFETGGTNRGYYINVAAGATSVGTNLVGGGGGSGTVISITAASPLTGGTITTSGTIGINASSTSNANYVVQRDASQNFAANTITANLFGTANLATYVVGGSAGALHYQNAVNTTAFLTAPSVNNSALLYNTSTNAPYWISPTGSMASLMGYTSTVTAAGFTSLTNASTYYQQFTGTTTQTVVLPNTATLALGWTFHIVNNSTANVTANTFANAATVLTIPAGTTAMVTCIDITANTAAAWEAGLTDFSSYTGTGSVVMNNSPVFTTPNVGAAIGTSLNVTGQLISTNSGAPLAVSSATVVANLASTYATRGAIVGNTVPTVANTSNMARIYVSSTAPVDTLVSGDIWISY
jgi:hypothetical protein